MKLHLLFFLMILFLMTSCGNGKKVENLESQVDSLSLALEQNQMFFETLVEVGEVLDSIDVNRNNLKLTLEGGMDFDDYKSRLKDLNEYVKDAENRIGELTASLSSSSRTMRNYEKSIETLRSRVKSQSQEIQELTVALEEAQVENQELITLADIQLGQIDDLTKLLNEKKEELELTQNRIDALCRQSQVNEADAYFARAQATEEAANRTKLAPKKKKDTYREALELYKKAGEMGHDGAEAKIKELKEKV